MLWHAAGETPIPIVYYQGVTADPLGTRYFDGIANGLHRGALTVDPEIPPDLEFNHIGDIAWDRREGGRILLPLECYSPQLGNTCLRGAIGVADPRTLRWRYGVELAPDEIAKAMWCEVSPDGRLVWTSSGGDLLAYRADAIKPGAGALRAVKRLPGAGALRAVKRLPGAAPPEGVTGAAFYGERLLLASQSGGTFRVSSVDTRTGRRRVEITERYSGESEGLSTNLDGTLDWIVTPVDPLGRPPTFRQNVLLHFRPARRRPAMRLEARRVDGVIRLRALGPDGPVAGAVVRSGLRYTLTGADGTARIRARHVTVARADLQPAKG